MDGDFKVVEDIVNEKDEESQRKKYFKETARDVEERLVLYNDVIFGGVLGRGVEDLWLSVRRDPAALTYLAEIYADRVGERVRTMGKDGLERVSDAARKILLISGGLPAEVHDRFGRRKKRPTQNFNFERDVLCLEEY